MASKSDIEWTDSSWNPVRGCIKTSPGCKNCYAERFAERFRGTPGHPFEYGFDVSLVPHKLFEPLSWLSPRLIFVNSMSDLFQVDVPDEYILAVCEVMANANWHTYQVLTKRSERMATMLRGPLRRFANMPHIWWGVSVEDRRYGLPRVADLRGAPASVRFLSVEPLLEDVSPLPLDDIHWVIVGGESGPGARPMQRKWVENVRLDCQRSNVAFFFKQWGGVRKKKTGRLLNGKTYDEMPTVTSLEAEPRDVRKQAVDRISSRIPLLCKERLIVLRRSYST